MVRKSGSSSGPRYLDAKVAAPYAVGYMKIRLPFSGVSSTRRSTRTEGLSLVKRSRYSCRFVGGTNRSRSDTPTLDGATTGCGDEGTEAWLAVW